MLSSYRKMWPVAGIVLFLLGTVFAYSGGTGEPNTPYQIATVSDWEQLMGTSGDWNKYFIMTDDIDLYDVAITPVGNSSTKFTGVFDGNGFIIYDATINTPGTNFVGLFGRVGSEGSIINLGVEDVNIIALSYAGGLAGYNDYGDIAGCYTTGTVTAGSDYSGGLTGRNGGSIINSYSACSVKGSSSVGGFVGSNGSSAADVNKCYSTGLVTGTGNYVGGLIGYNYGDVIDSFWDVNTSGKSTSAGGTGKTTAEMQDINTFLDAGWDFTEPVWKMSGGDYPRLGWEPEGQEPLPGDFVEPEGVGTEDLLVFSEQWLLEELSADTNKDGIVNFIDYADFADNWQGDMNQLLDFSSQWLESSAYCADIAPGHSGDGVVDFLDFAVFAENWMTQ